MRVAIAQITSSNQPKHNLSYVLDLMEQSAGNDILFLPEVTNCISSDLKHLSRVVDSYEANPFIAAVAEKAGKLGIWVALGSIVIKSNEADGYYKNRSLLINSQGGIVAFYDKIHMFDVALSETENYKESKLYKPGKRAVLVDTPWGAIGLTICYDLRFAGLYRVLATAGAHVLTAPSAFTQSTGKAHWHTLIRARAIETGCFLIASAQTGRHQGSGRRTYGHSLIVNPWGEVILDAGKSQGLYFANLDLNEVTEARHRIPSLNNSSQFKLKHYKKNE